MQAWQILAITVPLTFAIFQLLSKLLPQTISVYLVNAYASLIGLLFMLMLHFLFSPNKSLALSPKYVPLVIAIGLLISLGNFGTIKAYTLGAPQAIFTSIFYVILIIYGILLGLLFWHEKLNLPQAFGALLSIVGIIILVYFKK